MLDIALAAVAAVAGLVAGIGLAGLWSGRRLRRRAKSDDAGTAANEAQHLVSIIGGLAHELRNPLSSLKLNLQLLEEDLSSTSNAGLDEPIVRRMINRVQTALNEAARLEQTLQDFLLFASQPKPDLEPCDLNRTVAELVDFFTPQATSSGLQVRMALAQQPLICMLDVSLFKQAILNLLVNAQQATGPGGELIVRTSLLDDGKTARLEVIDTGCGIPPEEIDRIFAAYYSTKKGGTGLGLPITKKIVDAHGGRIGVASEVGKGSDFYIDLPLVGEPQANSEEHHLQGDTRP